MANIKVFLSQFIKDWKAGFKSNTRTVIFFGVFSTIWIFASDYLFALILSDLKLYAKIQSSKGMLYVIVTSLFLLFLTYSDFRKIMLYKKSSDRIDYLKDEQKDHGFKRVYTTINEIMVDPNQTIEKSAISVFNELFECLDCSDMGTVYQVKDNRVKFIHAIGYDLDLLNELPFSNNEFQVFNFNHNSYLTHEKHIKKVLGKEKYEEYAKVTPTIVEASSIAFSTLGNQYIGMSFDISKPHYFALGIGFTDEELNGIKDIQVLLNTVVGFKQYNTQKNNIQRDIVNTFIHAMEYHDTSSEGHAQDVSELSNEIGVELGLSNAQLEDLKWASLLHDIGNLVIPIELLNKTNVYTTVERNIMREHASVGASFLAKSESTKHIANYIRHHHEKYDGTGYPSGLEGNQISLIARIISLSDAWNAMISDRVYKSKFDYDQAIAEVLACKGTQFCPQVVDAFIRIQQKKQT